MKLTQTKLKQLIVEVINEVRVAPQVPSGLSDEHLAKIHTLIDSGEHEMARSLLDAFGASPSYIDDYMEYGEIGDLEKLGNKTAAMYKPITPDTPRDEDDGFPITQLQPGFTYDDINDLNYEADYLVNSKVKKQFGSTRDEYLDDYEFGEVPDDVEAAHVEHERRYYDNVELGLYPEEAGIKNLMKQAKSKSLKK
jgi:hypothetical protein